LCVGCLEDERLLYLQRAEQKLCVKCGAPAATGLKRCDRCTQTINRKNSAYKDRVKRETFGRYGGFRCACCGVTEEAFLTLDHIGGGGNKHRAEVKRAGGGNARGGGSSFYRWLRRHGYPPGYQVLCFNCNFAKWRLGTCPHQRKPTEASLPE
jgi:hypothetical protein